MSNITTSHPDQKKIKIRMFRFLELSWIEILTGNLIVDTANMVVKVPSIIKFR
jgi:hypothetical protein